MERSFSNLKIFYVLTVSLSFISRGILMAARELSLKGLLPSTSSAGSGFFTWLASDGWGKQKAVVADIQDFAVGAITVELESKRIQGNGIKLGLAGP